MREKAAHAIGRGISCMVIAVVIGLIGLYLTGYSQTGGGYGEGAAGGFIILIAAILGLIGIGSLIHGSVMAGATH